jgi:hypothetical protein
VFALCLVVASALGPPNLARAAPVDVCISDLPTDQAPQLQPLIQALSEVTGDAPSCQASQSDTNRRGLPSKDQQNIELIAAALALLALVDSGYGDTSDAYGYAAPGIDYSPPGYGAPSAIPAATDPTEPTDKPVMPPPDEVPDCANSPP